MRVIKFGEFGVKALYFNAGRDISLSTSYTVEFVKPSGAVLTVTATLGEVDKTAKDINGKEVTYLANQYTHYMFVQGDVDEIGCWMYRSLNPYAAGYVPGDYNELMVVAA